LHKEFEQRYQAVWRDVAAAVGAGKPEVTAPGAPDTAPR
jgi:hypothetical protein